MFAFIALVGAVCIVEIRPVWPDIGPTLFWHKLGYSTQKIC